MKKRKTRVHKISCLNCKHFYPCAYARSFNEKIREIVCMIDSNENIRDNEDIFFNIFAKECEYFEKDAYAPGGSYKSIKQKRK